jgi:hypothetical protein
LAEENGQAVAKTLALQKFIIERDIPKLGTFEREQLQQAAAKSNAAATRP